MGKNVVVIGGSGFLGSHVADVLSLKGYNVSVFDNVNSKHIKPNQKMIIGDIMNKDNLSKAIEKADFVYHFAGIADINLSRQKPIETIKSNILGTSNILEVCREFEIKRFVFASTIYVYSELGSFYRSSKQSCELIIENYSKEFDLDYSILRYGSLYGQRANNFNFIQNAIEQALTKGKIERKGNGKEIRDYIHVIDAAKASVEILSDDFINSHVTIKGNQTLTVKELLSMINEIMGNRLNINYLNEAKYEGHYQLTPYSFRPKVAKKVLLRNYLDLGQGLLDVIYDAYENLSKDNIGIGKEFLASKK